MADLFHHVAPDGVKALLVSDYARGDSELLDVVVERVLTRDLPRCAHLRRRPSRGYVFATEGYARCLACHLERAATGIPAGGATRCGCCSGEMTAGARPLVVEMTSWVVFSTLCLDCAQLVLDEGQRPASPAVPAGGGGE
ncbi:hypothetical protein [Streptomyces sp. NPDC005784]|uniref:hypothetical protein n=1 Tax=Streptomyces sp. NPDC005784 TaxID=3364731 RepID=UPI00368DE9D3